MCDTVYIATMGYTDQEFTIFSCCHQTQDLVLLTIRKRIHSTLQLTVIIIDYDLFHPA